MNYQGNDLELIYLETENFTFTIKGKPVHPDLEQLYPEREGDSITALLELESFNTEIMEFLHFDPQEGLKEYQSAAVYPCFYEWQDYQLIIQSKDGSQLEFYHSNRKIREAVTPLSRDQSILTGQINFRNDVGYSELEIRQDGVPLCSVKIEVFPSKLDYQRDYYNLLREVNHEVYNLAYDFLRRTFQEMSLSQEQDITHSEFFTILTTIFVKFKKALQRIKNSPHHRLQRTRCVGPASKVKKVTKQGIKWLRKNRQAYDQNLELPVEMLNLDKRVSFDTFENKFVKWMIEELIKKIKEFLERYRTIYNENAEPEVIKTARTMSEQLEYNLQSSFLSQVGKLHKIDSLSLVLQMAPGYRELYKYYLMLKKGLTINGQLFKQSIKETWKLYEYWCFLKLNRILTDRYQLIKSTLIDFDYSGIYVTLNTTRNSEVEYQNPRTGECFKLSYNLTEGDKVTTGQKPDTVLTLKKENSEVQYKFVFDAKYRINPAYQGSSYHNRYQTPGPKEETINTMHRYRDAIVSESNNDCKRTIVGAYVLFPYHNQTEFKEHHFYKSIDRVNVGAFPFLPGNIDLVADFLADLIEESGLSNYERNLLPTGNEEYRKQVDFKQNVIVGSLRQTKQLSQVLDKKIYHLPCNRIKDIRDEFEYLALYQSKNKFPQNFGVRYFGQLEKIEIKARKEIPIDLSPHSNPEEPYYLFQVKEWERLEQTIVPEGYGIRASHIYTNLLLLKKADTLPELSIRTLAEWRIWLELKHFKSELEVLISEDDIEATTKVDRFKINDYQISIKNKQVIISQKERIIIKEPIKGFIKQPRNILKAIR
ncbi:restriction endonuclease-like protein [Natroniella sulfidigena]|uniref:restriction endonuclease-like protein n=1 Tax=Natroniella sulfidigena TaxID=723921 RepID=UPI00200A01C0|nr:restriction endonuclease-like protein [Natroniella sulfidigena]MCK8816867.1 restriction endonuclease-like protein [Natroniella sulfidigena]